MKKNIVFSVILLILSSLCFLSSNDVEASSQDINLATASSTPVTPRREPTGDPTVWLGIWWTSGYSPNVESDYYTVRGHTVPIYASAGRALWNAALNFGLSPHYRWYKTSDYGKTWNSVSKSDNGNKMHFSVTPTEVGTFHYQMKTYYVMWPVSSDITENTDPLGWYHFYTRIAAVHVLDHEVNITDMDIDVNKYYLMYSTADNGVNKLSQDVDEDGIPDIGPNVANAKAILDPKESTGDINWSISDSSLATIDSDGKIVANAYGKSGTVTVQATFTNIDGTSLTRTSDPIQVGGGLNDETVYENQKATFTPLTEITGSGSDDSGKAEYSLTWYRIEANKFNSNSPYSNAVAISGANDKTYTTENTTLAKDNGAYYYLDTVVKTNNKTFSLKTNPAKLNVIPLPDTKNVKITNSIQNMTFSPSKNDAHNLFQVANRDNISYQASLTNESKSIIKSGHYVIPIQDNINITSVAVDDQILDSSQYQLLQTNDGTKLDISGINFNGYVTKNVTVDATIANITDEAKFSYTPYFYDESDPDFHVDATTETINLTKNTITINPENVIFQDIKNFESDTTKYRKAGKFSIQLDDTRRESTPLNLSVSQQNPWTKTDFPTTIDPGLQTLFVTDAATSQVGTEPTFVKRINSNNNSVLTWDNEHGPLLYVHPNTARSEGNYSTTLTWSLTDGI